MRLLWIFIALIVQIFGNDSLETAVKAVTNRQRNYQDDDSDEPYDDRLSFLPRHNEYESGAADSTRNLNLESSLMDYLREADNNDEMYQKSSAFRERLKQDAVRPYNRKYKVEDDDPNEQYYDQYQNSYNPPDYSKEPQNLYNMRKRSYYPSIRWESVGMKKRSRAFQPDGPRESLYLLNYAPRDEIFNRLQEDEDSGDDIDYQWPAYNQKKWDTSRTNKRFPVSKRSFMEQNLDQQSTMLNTHQYKRSSPTEPVTETDPKVAQDLADIFDPKETTKTIKQKTADDKSKTAKVANLKTKSTTVNKNNTKNLTEEKTVTPVPQGKAVPINNNKKSIDWSDYFGLDRRKKSEDSLDSDWLMDRYNKAVMQRQQGDKNDNNVDKIASRFDSDRKIEQMDNKLRNIEESLIDDTLKYTGAHEDSSDPKETRYVKDRIISRLAAAYSLEKMRRALADYRRAFQVERTLSHSEDEAPHENVKRMSIGRKAAIDPNNDNEKDDLDDNKIKCHNNDCSDAEAKNFGSEYLHELGTCPQIEAICNEISSGFGKHRNSVKAVCEMHQMCVLCSDNNWFGPLRHCDVLYLSKINEICGEDTNCRENVGNVLNHKLNTDQTSVCSLTCPEKK